MQNICNKCGGEIIPRYNTTKRVCLCLPTQKDCQSCRSSIEDEMVIKYKMERKYVEQETAQKIFDDINKISGVAFCDYTLECLKKFPTKPCEELRTTNYCTWFMKLKSKYGVK